MEKPLNKTILGASGEHYVMSQLLRRGMIAAMAPTGAPNIDILASNPNCHCLTDIQVKTTDASRSFSGWQLNVKQEDDARDNLIYCFVKFISINEMPFTWIIPSEIVAETIQKASRAYLQMRGRDGRQRKPGDRRWIRPRYPHLPHLPSDWLDEYAEAWQLITERR